MIISINGDKSDSPMIAVIVLLYLVGISLSIGDSITRLVNDVDVIQEANFAIVELTKLSDSGIYTTIKLARILNATSQDGIYHNNVILGLELESKYFKSGLKTEEFEMIVMTHKHDGIKSIAINEFPVMNEEAIEIFTIEKIERKRKEKEESLRKIELEHILLNPNDEESKDEFNINHFSKEDIKSLFSRVETKELYQYLHNLSNSLQKRLPPQQLLEEKQLQHLSLFELYKVSIKEGESIISDYQVSRANQILNSALNQLRKVKRIKNS